ncbi:MAG: hypothetical protein HOO97_06780 [Sideroxydans sp.]|nr:hypothetical protein [Sideroxydans sp.]
MASIIAKINTDVFILNKQYKSAFELELMRNIKKSIDPHGHMNPGKVI